MCRFGSRLTAGRTKRKVEDPVSLSQYNAHKEMPLVAKEGERVGWRLGWCTQRFVRGSIFVRRAFLSLFSVTAKNAFFFGMLL